VVPEIKKTFLNRIDVLDSGRMVNQGERGAVMLDAKRTKVKEGVVEWREGSRGRKGNSETYEKRDQSVLCIVRVLLNMDVD